MPKSAPYYPGGKSGISPTDDYIPHSPPEQACTPSHYDVHFIVKDSTVLKNRFTLSTGKVNASDVLYDLETVSNICFTEVEDGLFEVGTK